MTKEIYEKLREMQQEIESFFQILESENDSTNNSKIHALETLYGLIYMVEKEFTEF